MRRKAVLIAPIAVGGIKTAYVQDTAKKEIAAANAKLTAAQREFRKAKLALEVDTTLVKGKICQVDDTEPLILCRGTERQVYRLDEVDSIGQVYVNTLATSKERIGELTAEIKTKSDDVAWNMAGAFAGYAGFLYGVIGVVVLINRAIKAVKGWMRRSKEKKAEEQPVIDRPEPVQVREPVRITVSAPELHDKPAKRVHAPDEGVAEPKLKRRPANVPKDVAAAPVRIDERVDLTVNASIEARFRSKTTHEKRLIQLATGPLTTFVREYIAYLDKTVGSRGAFAMNGGIGGFREKWAVDGTPGFGYWRVFSCKINGTGRVVVMVDVNQRRFGVYGVYNDHDKYTHDVAWFDPRNIRPNVEIALPACENRRLATMR